MMFDRSKERERDLRRETLAVAAPWGVEVNQDQVQGWNRRFEVGIVQLQHRPVSHPRRRRRRHRSEYSCCCWRQRPKPHRHSHAHGFSITFSAPPDSKFQSFNSVWIRDSSASIHFSQFYNSSQVWRVFTSFRPIPVLFFLPLCIVRIKSLTVKGAFSVSLSASPVTIKTLLLARKFSRDIIYSFTTYWVIFWCIPPNTEPQWLPLFLWTWNLNSLRRLNEYLASFSFFF